MTTLYCEMGKHEWERESQRGRPPKSCPDCSGGGILQPLDPRLTRFLDPAYKLHDDDHMRQLHFIATTLKTGMSPYGGVREDADLRLMRQRGAELLEKM